MAEDMAPALIEAVKAAFTRLMAADSELAEKLAKIQAGSVSYTDALDYADRVGHALAQALGEELTVDTLPDGTLYYNIAQRLITEVGGEACTLAASAAEMVQSELNHNADLDYLNPIKAKTTNERLTGLINTVSGKPITETASTLAAGARALPQGIVSDTMEANAKFLAESDLDIKIVRKSAYKCCEWCSRMAGTYPYAGGIRQDVYRRHDNCRCAVDLVETRKNKVTSIHTGTEGERRYTSDGYGGYELTEKAKRERRLAMEATAEERAAAAREKRIATWAKKKAASSTTAAKQDIIEERKTLGLGKEKTARQRRLEAGIRSGDSDTVLEAVREHHEAFADYTPETFKRALEEMGYTVRPLGRGNFKGVPFEEGGGYRITFGGDGSLRYHPEERSHHGGAYYRVKTGKGTEIYDTRGQIITGKANGSAGK